MFDLITTAYAESGTSTTAGGGMSSILMRLYQFQKVTPYLQN